MTAHKSDGVLFLKDVQSIASIIEFLKFYGEDPKEWIIHVEQYFKKFGTHADMKIYKVLVSMEGPSLDWFHGLRR